GAYNRPICRRILEEAGVPRQAFGTAKKNTSVLMFERRTFLSPDSWHEYSGWLAERHVQGATLLRRGPTRLQTAAQHIAAAPHAGCDSAAADERPASTPGTGRRGVPARLGGRRAVLPRPPSAHHTVGRPCSRHRRFGPPAAGDPRPLGTRLPAHDGRRLAVLD